MRLHMALLAGVLTMTANSLSAQAIDRTKPPETPPLPAYHLPPVYQTQLPNGLSVVLLADARFPMVTVRLAFEAGSRAPRAAHRGRLPNKRLRLADRSTHKIRRTR